MSISKQIKSKGLPSSKHVYDGAGISKFMFYDWAVRMPRVVELLIKGLLYERENDERR